MSHASLNVEVQPPAVARLGEVLEPPLVLKLGLGSSSNGYNGDMGKIWAHASLVNGQGDVMDTALRGSLVASAHSMSGESNRVGYFLFDNLAINNTGRFRIRVTLMRMDAPNSDGSYATSVEQADTRVIVVEDGEVQRWVPSPSEQRFLESLPY